jgi:hypothetical protein
VSGNRGWVERPGRSDPGTQPPAAHPEPGPGRPRRSSGAEPAPLAGHGQRDLPPVPGLEGRAPRVVLVSRDHMLAGALRSLIEAPGGVRMLDWYGEALDGAIRHADVVVVDVPPHLHEPTFAVIDGRFLGRTVVLLQEGEHPEALPPGPPRAVLYRPLQIGELWSAITGTAPPEQPLPEAAEEPGPSGSAPAVGEGLPVAESGRLIGPSGRELEPVVGPGQVAPGMDRATLDRLRRWVRQPADRASQPPGRRRTRAGREQARRSRAARAAARRAAREESRRTRAARTVMRKTAREEARWAKAAEAERRQAARAEAREARKAQGAVDRAARAEVRRAKAAEAKARRAERAQARGEARQARAVKAEARRAARAEAGQARAVRREESRQARAARAEARRAARAEARRVRAARTVARREQRREANAAQNERRQAARAEATRQRAERAETRKVAREASRQARAARAAERRTARQEAARVRAANAEVRRAESSRVKAARAEERKVARAAAARKDRGWVGGVVRPAVVVVVMAAVGLAAAGWRGGGGPDTLAGEVAVVRAAGGSGGGLVVQDPRVGPIEPLPALAVGAWLRVTEAGRSLEGAILKARAPSRFLLAVVVALTVLLFLLLMRVGPGTGAAAGPGPAPPHGQERPAGNQGWRLGAAALAGALVALDPVVVRSGRVATGTILAVVLALATLALAWGLPARPTLRWLPLVAAGGGMALLVSPLALGVLAAPVVAELLRERHREAWRSMAALGLAVGLWLLLPIWVAGQDLAAGQAGWLLGRPPGRGSLAAAVAEAPLTWLLVAAGLAAAVLPWRHRSGARSEADAGAARLVAWSATTAAGALVAILVGYPASQALPFAVPAAAVSLAGAAAWAVAAAGESVQARRLVLAGVGLAMVGLLAAQGLAWGARYGGPDDGLARLVATVGRVPDCSAINAGGPHDRARLLAAGATVTDFSDGPAAHAAGVRYFVLTGGTAQGGPMTPSLATWVRQHGTRLAAHPSRTLSGLELWRVDAAPLDPVADNLRLPDGVFANVRGSACGGYRVVDGQVGAFYSGYQAAGGKAVLGRPLGSVWTSDGPALQAFDTMVLGAVAATTGPPEVRPIELPPLLAKLDVEAVADADIPLPSTRPASDRQARALLSDKLIARAYLGTDPATASDEDWRRARSRFGRPLGMPQVMPDGAVRQPFERAVLELPADGGPARPAALGRLAVRLGLVPRQAMRPEPVPGLPARPTENVLDAGPLLRSAGGALLLLGLAAGTGAVAARRRPRPTRSG